MFLNYAGMLPFYDSRFRHSSRKGSIGLSSARRLAFAASCTTFILTEVIALTLNVMVDTHESVADSFQYSIAYPLQILSI